MCVAVRENKQKDVKQRQPAECGAANSRTNFQMGGVSALDILDIVSHGHRPSTYLFVYRLCLAQTVLFDQARSAWRRGGAM